MKPAGSDVEPQLVASLPFRNNFSAGRNVWCRLACLLLFSAIFAQVAVADNVSYTYSATNFPVVGSFSFTVTAADFITTSGTFFSFNSFSSSLACSLQSVTLDANGTITFSWMPLCNGSDSGITGFGEGTITAFGDTTIISNGGATTEILSVHPSNLPVTGPAVAEPSSMVLFGCGLFLLALIGRRLRRLA